MVQGGKAYITFFFILKLIRKFQKRGGSKLIDVGIFFLSFHDFLFSFTNILLNFQGWVASLLGAWKLLFLCKMPCDTDTSDLSVN